LDSSIDEIENNFLYNIPNIICYLYSEIGDSMRELIVSLACLYEKETWEKFLWKDWNTIKRFPVSKLKSEIEIRDLPEEYIIYLLGNTYLRKYNKNDKKHKYKYDPAELLQKSSLYRKKLLDQLPRIENIDKAEFIRKLIHHMTENMYDIDTISDKKWIEFLIEKSEEDLKEVKFKLEQTENQDVKKDLTKKLEEADSYSEEIRNIDLSWLSEHTSKLFDQQDANEYKDKLIQSQKIHDINTESMIEKKIAIHVLSLLSRYKKNDATDNNSSGLPKYFQENWEYTCFSGTWLTASLLLQYWFDQDRLFFSDSMVGAGWNAYKHSYLLYKLSDGKYIKIDYAFGNTYDTVNYNPTVERLEYWIDFWEYSLNRGDNDTIGDIYRLNDGLSLMYLVNLMWFYFHEWNYDKVIEVWSIAKSVSINSYHIYELEWLTYSKLEDQERAKKSFKKTLDLNRFCPSATFKMWEILFHEWNYKEAQKKLASFKKLQKKWRKIDASYIQLTEEYWLKMKEDINTDEAIIEDFLAKYLPKTGYMDGLDGALKDYFSFSEEIRFSLIQEMIKMIKTSDEFIELLWMIWFFVHEEENKESPLLPKIKELIQEIFWNNLTK